jgi:hypothetical protein
MLTSEVFLDTAYDIALSSPKDTYHAEQGRLPTNWSNTKCGCWPREQPFSRLAALLPDPATEETVGITVISFSRHFPFLRGQVPDEGEIETRDVMKALLAA